MPTMHGIIDRRMLVNFRAQPDVVRALLPARFRPKLVKGWAIVGICLIRLKDIRPRGLPAMVGLTSENAAHRIAVEWDENGQTREGVYIPRRDTSSNLQSVVGGRIFPGIHHVADFKILEHDDIFELDMRARDGSAFVELSAKKTVQSSAQSVFSSVAEASDFFANGSIGYSPAKTHNCCDGLQLCTAKWHVDPLDVLSVRSSFFDDRTKFPIGTIHFDCALLMQDIEHEWRILPQIKGIV